MEQVIMALSEFLKDKRKKLNLTQQQLAEKAGVGLRFVRVEKSDI